MEKYNCNFIYSLLGIETEKTKNLSTEELIAISFTPY